MDTKFIEVMEKRSDSELLEIVTKLRDDYQPDAIETAELVIKQRNLSTDQVEQAKEEIIEKELSLAERANESLNIGQRILFFIFFWGIIPWAMAGTFKTSGFLKKYKEAWRFMKYGLLTFIGLNGLIILIAYLSFK